MGAIGRILIILVVLAVVAAGVVFFVLPPVASRTAGFDVQKPAASVFTRIANTPAGTQIADGVTQNAVTSAANNVVVADVAYADGATGRATYTVSPQGQGSHVELKLERDLGANPLNRIGAITGAGVGPLVTAAADTVSADVGHLPNADFEQLSYEVVQAEAQPFFYVENCASNDTADITSVIAQAVAGIPPVMRQKGLTPSGPLMAVEPRVVQGQYCYQVGYPFRGRAPTGALLIGKVGQTPGGALLHMHYTGVEADVVPQVYDRMDALLGAAHLDDPATPNDDWTTFEVYNDDPTQAGGSRNRDIYYVTQGDISRLTNILAPSALPAAAPAAAAGTTTTAPGAETTTTTTTTSTTTTPAPATTP